MTLWFVLERLLKAVSLISIDFFFGLCSSGKSSSTQLEVREQLLESFAEELSKCSGRTNMRAVTQRVGLSCNWIIHRRKA